MSEDGNIVAKEVFSETVNNPDNIAGSDIQYNKSELLFVLGFIEALRAKNIIT